MKEVKDMSWHALFFLVLLSGIAFRSLNIPLIMVSPVISDEPDATRFLRQAEIIAREGKLPTRDMDRWLPEGRDLKRYLSLSSYIIAYGWKATRIIIPGIKVRDFAIVYPIICFSFFLILFYLFLRSFFGSSFAIISSLLLSISPTSIMRSIGGFADRDPLCLLLGMASFLFWTYGNGKGWRRTVIHGILSGAMMGFLGLSWEGFGLFSSVIILYILILSFMGEVGRDDLILYVSWFVPCLIMTITMTEAFRDITIPFSFLGLVFPIIVGILVVISFLLEDVFGIRKAGMFIILSLFLISGIIFLIPMFIPKWEGSRFISDIFDNLISPLGRSRLMVTVSELQKPWGLTWHELFGPSVLLIAFGGAILTMKVFGRVWVPGAVAFELILGSYMFCNLRWRNTIIYGEGDIRTMFLALSFILAIGAGIWMRMESQIRNRSGFGRAELFVLSWFVVMLLATRGAIRFAFFLAPPAMILAGYGIGWACEGIGGRAQGIDRIVWHILAISIVWAIYGFERFPLIGIVAYIVTSVSVIFLISRIHGIRRLLGYGIIILVTVLISVRYSMESRKYIERSTRVMDERIADGLKWMRDGIPESSVVGAWWDYGSYINYISNKRTIIDEDHYIPYRIYEFARHFFCALSEDEALRFLKTFGVTHVMITWRDMRLFHLISWLGSNQDMDRTVLMIPFLPTRWKRWKKGERILSMIPLRHLPTQDEIFVGGKRWKSGEWKIIRAAVLTREDRIKDVFILIIAGNEAFWIRPREAYMNGEKVPLRDGRLPGIFAMERIVDNIRGVYVPEKGRELLGIRIWFLGRSHHFMKLYPRSDRGDVRIWEIRYPCRIVPDPSYFGKDFEDESLRRSWIRGDKGILLRMRRRD